ncbi:DUF1471 domain-containing protein [Pantoea ananatis]|uniref:DUF1471 domain-containing protein n=1 Tax=Pantoea ananas TaxID=553 RepID=UPI000E235B1E|nr:DUF1471 domain-containing protein [Pantoea ananatis]REE68888.1 uncharacterized protein DUF1471 [Pantoea ananatis]
MKINKVTSAAAAVAFSLMSFGCFAQTVSATSSTLDGAVSKIARQAKQQGDHFRVISADTNNYAHVTAELYK